MKEKIKEILPISILLLIILGIVFYWYEWRPTQIRKECGKECSGFVRVLNENCYKDCLYRNGINE